MTRLRAPRNGREHAGPLAALTVPLLPALPRAIALAVALAVALPPAPLLAQTPAKPAAPGRAAPAEDTASLNFVNADLEATVRAIGQYTGRQFVIDPRVKGTINLVTERPVTKQQAYEQLLSALRLQGFTIVESPGGISRILPEADAKLQGGRVIAPSQQAPRGDQIVTQVFEMQYESATNMVPVLRPLIAPNNTISAYPANNSLVITDYADNLRRIRDIIAAIDRPASAESEIVPLKYGLALEIATVANRILDEGARAAGQATDGGQRVQVLAEPRTNSLILRTSSRARAFAAKQLIEKLDQPSVTPGNINVVYLRNAQAVRLAQTLRAVISADPSFTPQTGGTGGLSAGGSAFGSSTTGQAGITQQQQQPQIQPQQVGGTGSGGGGTGPLAGMIQADPSTNSLIITAPEPLYRNIRTIIEKLDVRPAQVVIESLIVEVTADKAAEFGIQWQALGGFSEENSNNTSVVGGTNFGGAGTNIIGAAVNPTTLGAGLNLGIIRGTVTIAGQEITNLGFLARALETSANGNVLAQPNIQTLDNEEAKFLVGQNVPFVTGSFTQAGQAAGAVNPFQTFERRDVGLQLRVKPQISEGGNVRLAIYLEVSSVVPGTLQGGVITNKRSFESNVVVEDGNFVVLSGLIEDRTTNSESRVPLLGSIPGIGWLFRYENRDRKKTNTMVFLRPVVVRDEATSAVVAANRYEYMRTQTQQAQKPDNWVLRGYEGNQLPPLDQISPPSKPRGAVPTPGSPSAPTAPGATPPATAPAPAPAAAAPSAPAPTGNFAASASSPPPRGTQQLLQVMATSDVARGRELSKQLREAGFDAFWESVRAPGSADEMVRVRVAVDPSPQALSAAIADLRRRGFEPVPVTP
jgi:general secretion pathway protein D